MDIPRERDLEILTAIGEGRPLTQRALAERLGVALGLANLYVKRLATKGYIKVVDFPRKPGARKRLRYLLTPRGIAEKTRLTYEYVGHSLALYRRTRQTLRDSLRQHLDGGVKRVALYGVGEAAELAYVTLRELGVEPVAVFAETPGGHFLGLPVLGIAEAVEDGLDAIVVATFDRPEPHQAALAARGFPRDKVLTLRRPLPEAASAT
jgi:DNA-binding MarR family transcriptional regulator